MWYRNVTSTTTNKGRVMNHVLWTICWLSVALMFAENARDESQAGRANHGDDRRISVQVLHIPGSGTDEEAIDYAALPILHGQHAIVNAVAPRPHAVSPDKMDMHHLRLNLHNYLVHHDGKFWCIWSDGPKLED